MTGAAVCFDLDDTLYDYLRYARTGLESAGDYLEARPGRRLHDELYDIYFEDGVTDRTFDVLVDRYDIDPEHIPALVDAFHDATEPLQPYPEAELVLSQLAEDYRLGLITDGRGGEAKLNRLGLAEYFETVLVTPTIDSSKENPEVFERVLSTLAVPPADATYVGDDPRVDFRVPNQLGMTTVRLRRGRYRHLRPADVGASPDREVCSLTDLLGLVAVAEPPDRRALRNR